MDVIGIAGHLGVGIKITTKTVDGSKDSEQGLHVQKRLASSTFSNTLTIFALCH